MPSRNSVNKPKMAIQRARKGAYNAIKGNLKKVHSTVLTSQKISKKRAKKNQRNLSYTLQRLTNSNNSNLSINIKDKDGDVVIGEESNSNEGEIQVDTISKTAMKKLQRLQKVMELKEKQEAERIENEKTQISLEQMVNDPSVIGTVLGHPPVAVTL